MGNDTEKSVLVLDQWADANANFGTSKNWLYHYFNKVYECQIVNADNGIYQYLEKLQCMTKALCLAPLSLRKEYYRNMENIAKYPRSFRLRSDRFEKALSGISGDFDATFQIGGLFGPLSTDTGHSFSYHDQTVAIVEREWPEWLPRKFHTFRDEFFELEKATFEAKSKIFSYSEYTRKSIITDYGISPDKVIVTPTACKIDYPAAAEILQERDSKIVFISTDFLRKGGDIVFSGYKKIREKNPNVELVIVGGRFATPVPEGAVYKGLLSQKELQSELLSASLLVHPARHDAFPNVLKEAMACGVPVVASNSAGIPEIVRHGDTGVIMNKNCPEELSEIVSALLNDRKLLGTMRENCLSARDIFRPSVCAANITTAMNTVMNGDGNKKLTRST